jgi:gamma-glutamyltranspeptidase/glutathione hydrolase
MSIADAMSAPRIHHQSLPDSIRLESGGFDSTTIARLHQMGHSTYELFGVASAEAIMRVRGGYEGMPDPRGRGAAVGF